ncbi:hypothetical protein DH86_00000912, partial [Scytalidium sp. 3C]
VHPTLEIFLLTAPEHLLLKPLVWYGLSPLELRGTGPCRRPEQLRDMESLPRPPKVAISHRPIAPHVALDARRESQDGTDEDPSNHNHTGVPRSFRRTLQETSIEDAPTHESGRQYPVLPREDSPVEGVHELGPPIQKGREQSQDASMSLYLDMIKTQVVEAPIDSAGRVGYIGEHTNLTMLFDEAPSTVHFALPNYPSDYTAVSTKGDAAEMEILRKRGALVLPDRDLCDELVE